MREHATVLKKLVSNRVLVTKTKQAFAQALRVRTSQTKLGQLCWGSLWTFRGRESPSSRPEIIPGEGDFQFVRINELHSPPPRGPMDIATEEFSHLEIAGATIQMLLGPVNGKLKNTVEINPVAKLADGRKGTKEQLIHQALQILNFWFCPVGDRLSLTAMVCRG